MPLRDEQLAQLADRIERENIALAALRIKKEHELRALKDANSALPATVEFLRGRGLTHVSQLDRQGVRELTEHLRRVLRGLRN